MNSPLPKVIWLLWLQGWDEAPAIVQACLKTWQENNPGWTIHKLSQENLYDYLDDSAFSSSSKGNNLQAEAFSDVIRISLLERYGGIWIDSTVYCLKPLDTWLPEKLDSGFFAFEKPSSDRMVASWFLAASKGNYIVKEWHRRVLEYWTHRTKRHHYFWFHYLFEEAYNADPFFQASWDATPKVSDRGPHYYSPYKKLSATVSSSDILLLKSQMTPVQKFTHKLMKPQQIPVLKLTHKLSEARYSNDSVFSHLLKFADEAQQGNCVNDIQQKSLFPRDLLVAWYGSFDGNGTIGDLLAMQSVVTHLAGLGYNVFHASAGEVRVVGSDRVQWQAVSSEDFDAFIFVCGPILKHHPNSQALFSRFDDIHKIGVSVSLFPAHHVNHFDPFDQVLAREGKSGRFEDVAILAPASIYRPLRTRKKSPTIGVSLRGKQSEYGVDLCLWEQTEKLVNEAANLVIEQLGGRIVIIENHLRKSRLSQEEIEAQYADCDLIITSRFHGAMMALRHLVPFVAIDQIEGGAKVLNLVGATRWPFVYEVGTIDPARLVSDAFRLLLGEMDRELFDVRTQAIKRANETLLRLGEHVRATPSKRHTIIHTNKTLDRLKEFVRELFFSK